ncbi:uncharacterized protein L199_006611 [Kwoniella botswanensis]|uniref:uncharacterized protein n=1 Tax=Kwoniella botswanensis TaxID=1268659 RepID=UPI00315CB7F1
MVLINEKKYACEKCIKGHRVSGCTHTDRPLYEIKKKGRPATQCSHCKDKRKLAGSSVHTKCACGDTKNPPSTSVIQLTTTQSEQSSSSQGSDQEKETETEVEIETRKGQPGSKATFPRGFKDVLELAAAANALAGLVKDDVGYRIAERSVSALLNPCKCQSGGPCKCCQPKKDSNTSESSSGDCCGSSTPGNSIPRPSPSLTLNPHLSPENMHHPAHTSPHVHKTKLFSPYSTNPASSSRHGRRDTISSNRNSGRASPLPKSLRPPPPRIKPLTDFGRLIGAAINQDGSINSEIPRSAVGLPTLPLPGISTFDTAAENGGSKVEHMEYEDIDIDMPLAFPTSEDVVIGACMCGEDCSCPGCATHDNGIATTDENGVEHSHELGQPCGEGCKGRHDCCQSIAVPSGVTSIAHLISLAASHVPPPPETNVTSLNPHDTRILPPSAQMNEEIARTMGFVQLKPLECCNGRCQCAPGECTCEKECCGCCVRCSCAEDDEDARMDGVGSQTQDQSISSCCFGKANDQSELSNKQSSPPNIALPSENLNPNHNPIQPSPTLLSPPDIVRPPSTTSRRSSPVTSGTTTPVNGATTPVTSAAIRRAASISSKSANGGHDVSSSSHRRATVTGNPPVTASGLPKSNTKAITPYNPQHHRTILPKPSTTHLSVNTSTKSSCCSRQPSSSGQKRGSASVGPTRSGSPSNSQGGERRASTSTENISKSTTLSSAQIQHTLPEPMIQLSEPSQSLPQEGAFQWPLEVQQLFLQSQASGQPTAYPNPKQFANGIGQPSAPPGELDLDPFAACSLSYLHHTARTGPSPSEPQSQLQSQTQSQIYHRPPVQPQVQSQPQAQAPPVSQTQAIPAFDDKWFNQILQQQQPGLLHDVSGNTSPELDQPFDLEQFISQAVASQSQDSQQPQQSVTNFTDYFVNGILDPSYISQTYDQQVHNDPTLPVSFDPASTSNQHRAGDDAPPFVPMVPGLPSESHFQPNWTSGGVKHQLMEDGRRQLREIYSHQQQQQQQQQQRNQQYQVDGIDQTSQQSANTNTVSSGSTSGTTIGDIIDLSKPLNPDTLNKIMKALEKHNNQQQLSTATSSSTTNTDQDISQPNSSTNTNMNGSESLDVPLATTKDLDDMFNQFVTLDNNGIQNFQSDGDNASMIIGNGAQGQVGDDQIFKYFGLG